MAIKRAFAQEDTNLQTNTVKGSRARVYKDIDLSFTKKPVSGEIYKKEDSTKKEISEFIDSLSQDQFKNVMNFFETMPKLKHTINWKCTGCGCDDEVTLEGMGNFFAL